MLAPTHLYVSRSAVCVTIALIHQLQTVQIIIRSPIGDLTLSTANNKIITAETAERAEDGGSVSAEENTRLGTVPKNSYHMCGRHIMVTVHHGSSILEVCWNMVVLFEYRKPTSLDCIKFGICT